MTTKILRCIILIVLSLFLCRCARPASPFNLTEEHFKIKGTTIAVLAGLDNELTVQFAAYVSDSLKERSNFRVVPQREIARTLPSYPSDIRGPYTSAYFSVREDYENTDVGKLKEISRRLGADYLYVLWVPTSYTSDRGKIYNVLQVAQLYEFPEGTEVGRSAVRIPAAGTKGEWWCCLMPSPRPQDISDRLKLAADDTAEAIAVQTGTAKKSQHPQTLQPAKH
jgi:hypothetical protein